jgi:hypothetical protein
VISLTQSHLPDNTQHSQQTDMHVLGGIRTHDLGNERPQTHALDSAATRIGVCLLALRNWIVIMVISWYSAVKSSSRRRSHTHHSQGIVMCTNFHKFNYWKESKSRRITISKFVSSWGYAVCRYAFSQIGKASSLMEFQLKSARRIRLPLYQKSLSCRWNLPPQSRNSQDNSKVEVIGH